MEKLIMSAPESNFEYTLNMKGIKVLELNINGTSIKEIKSKAKIFADDYEPFWIKVRAVRFRPNGSGSLQLKNLKTGKEIFESPKQFKFERSGVCILLLKDVKIR